MSQPPINSLSAAIRFARRKRGIVAILTAVLVLAIATHASVFAEENQYHHAFSHVTNVIPSFRRSGLTFDKRLGLAKVDKHKLTTHPIRQLIERAQEQYDEQQRKIASITTLEDAVKDYREAYDMEPPRGFDTWYEWTVENKGLAVPSLLGQAVRPLKPFLAYPPEILRRRLYGDQHEAYAFCVVFQREGDGIVLNVTEPQVHKRKYWSPPAVKELWEPIVHLVPKPFDEDPDTFLIFGWEDAPVRVVSDEIMQRSKDLADKGLMWDPAVLNNEERQSLWSYGWTQMCPYGSPFRQIPPIKMEQDMKVMYPYRDDVPHEEKTFIYDNQASMDWCENPILTQLSNTLVQDFWRRSGPMIPMFGQSRLHNSPELTWTPTMAFGKTAPENVWEDKVFGKLLWRGSPTGMLHSNTTAWRAQQRHRIAHLMNHPKGTRKVIVEEEGYLGTPVADIREYETKDLVDRYLNISFTGSKDKPPFCWHDGTCAELERDLIYHPRVEPTEAVKFRYILDIDGYGWSSRFRRELTTGSVMVKATIYPEWYFDIIIPWHHYVPLQMDYSDLFDIMSFFEGSPDGSTPHNHALAKAIGDRGKKFVEERWREEDLQSFGLLQILEYQRMWSSDRKKASYGYQA